MQTIKNLLKEYDISNEQLEISILQWCKQAIEAQILICADEAEVITDSEHYYENVYIPDRNSILKCTRVELT